MLLEVLDEALLIDEMRREALIPQTSKRALEIAIQVIGMRQSAALARIADAKEIFGKPAFLSACSTTCLCNTAVEFKTALHLAQRQGVSCSRVRESCTASTSTAASANDAVAMCTLTLQLSSTENGIQHHQLTCFVLLRLDHDTLVRVR